MFGAFGVGVIEQVGDSTTDAYDELVLADNPFAYWPLTETSGSKGVDLAGDRDLAHKNDFIAGSTTTGGDPAGGPVLEHGPNGAWSIVSGGQGAVPVTDSFTVEGWIYCQPNTSIDFNNEVMRANDAACQLNTGGSGEGVMAFFDGNSQIVSGGTVFNGQWHHTVWRWTSGTLEIILDTQVVGSAADSNDYSWTQTAKNSSNRADDQKLSRIAIYDFSLGDQQIQDHFDAGKP